MKLSEAIKETLREAVEPITKFKRNPKEYRMDFLHCISVLPTAIGFAICVFSGMILPRGEWNFPVFIVGMIVVWVGMGWLFFWERVLRKIPERVEGRCK